MSFGDLLDGGASAAGMQYPYGVFASSPALSLAVVRTTYAPDVFFGCGVALCGMNFVRLRDSRMCACSVFCG
jgi:hypothetical protein